MRLNDEKIDKTIDEIKERMNQLLKRFDENEDLINEYENKNFIEH
jgi:GTP cyclohydrolase FolE2